MEHATLLAIYDAALAAENWTNALDRCAEATDAKAILLYETPSITETSYRLDAASSDFARVADILSDYNAMMQQGTDSGYDQQGLGHTHRSPLLALNKDTDIWTMDAAHNGRPEMVLNLRAGYYRRALLNLSDDPSILGGMIFLFGPEHDAVLPAALDTVAPILAPHVKKALELHRLANGLRRKYEAVLSVLDRVDVGVLLLTEKGDVVLANQAARQICDKQDGLLFKRNDSLMITDAASQIALKEAVSLAARTAGGDGSDTGGAVQIRRRKADTPIMAMVSPLRDANMEIDRSLTGAIVTLIDPDRSLKIDLDLLVAAYGLTPSETRTAALVLQGLTNSEIAERTERSPETIKSQLTSIFRKSACRNRLEFLWRIFQLSPPIL